ncbi:DUF6035 family protein [Marinobacter sp. MBR-105]
MSSPGTTVDRDSSHSPASKVLDYIWSDAEHRMLPIDQLIPEDPAKAQALRRHLAETYLAHRKAPDQVEALWRCPVCWEPLLLAGRPRGGFYVRHRQNPAYACPYKNGADLSLSEWDALRFNGQKESVQHIQLKEQIRSMLEEWPGAHSIQVEPTIRGSDKLSWKRPDVMATIDGQEIAFEIQLSSTYLDVIVDRERFYRDRGVIVCWVFGAFTHEGHRLYERDIYYHHNGNAFELNAAAISAARTTGIPHFTCHYLEPNADNGNIRSTWRTAIVPITEITLCPETFRVYWFDHDTRRKQLEAQQGAGAHIEELRWLITENEDADDLRTVLRNFLDDLRSVTNLPLPTLEIDIGAIRIMEVILSAQEGCFVGELGGSNNANWPFWANTIFEHHSGYAKAFLRVTHHYGITELFSGRPSWQKKKANVAEKRRQGKESERTEWWPLFELLAPECDWSA